MEATGGTVEEPPHNSVLNYAGLEATWSLKKKRLSSLSSEVAA